MGWLLLLLPGTAIVAWFIRWRRLAARERWRNQNAARYARWAHSDDAELEADSASE